MTKELTNSGQEIEQDLIGTNSPLEQLAREVLELHSIANLHDPNPEPYMVMYVQQQRWLKLVQLATEGLKVK